MAFVEVQLPVGYDRASVGGPTYSTIITETSSGREYRSRRWAESRGTWDIGNRKITGDVLDTLIAFFRARGGRADGFRFKDWSDYQATDQALTINYGPTSQLVKRYQDAGGLYDRTISKPVSGSVTFSRNGSAYTTPTVDTTTGVVTFAADVTQLSRTITYGTTSVITVSSTAGLSVGQYVWLTGVSGFADQAAQILAVDGTGNTITVALDTSANTGTGSCNVYLYPQASESILWSGEFDVPARFDTDQFKGELVNAPPNGAGTRVEYVFLLQTIPIVEVRV